MSKSNNRLEYAVAVPERDVRPEVTSPRWLVVERHMFLQEALDRVDTFRRRRLSVRLTLPTFAPAGERHQEYPPILPEAAKGA